MNAPSPIARALLDMALLNGQGESVLRIGQGAQNLHLELANLTDHDIQIGDAHGTELRVTFRPGALERADAISAEGAGWTGAMQGGRAEFQTLVLKRAETLTLSPGDVHKITLKGLIPSGSGGSRATRVEVEYADLHLPGEGAASGRRTLHLSILHAEIGAGQTLGSQAAAGGMTAEIVSSADVISGGGPATLRVRLATGAPLALSVPPGEADDDRPKIGVRFPGASTDTMRFAGRLSGWKPGGHWLSYAGAQRKTLSGGFLEFGLSLQSSLPPGLYPLTLTLENFDGADRVLSLLVRVAAIGLGTDGKVHANAPLVIDNGGLTATGDVTTTGGSVSARGGLTGAWLDVRNGDVTLGKHYKIAVQKNIMRFLPQNGKNAQFWLSDNQDSFTLETRGKKRILVKGALHTNEFEMTGSAKIGKGLTVGGKLTVSKGGATIDGPLHVDGTVDAHRINLPHGWYIHTTDTQFIIRKDGKTMLGCYSSGTAVCRHGNWYKGAWK